MYIYVLLKWNILSVTIIYLLYNTYIHMIRCFMKMLICVMSEAAKEHYMIKLSNNFLFYQFVPYSPTLRWLGIMNLFPSWKIYPKFDVTGTVNKIKSIPISFKKPSRQSSLLSISHTMIFNPLFESASILLVSLPSASFKIANRVQRTKEFSAGYNASVRLLHFPVIDYYSRSILICIFFQT